MTIQVEGSAKVTKRITDPKHDTMTLRETVEEQPAQLKELFQAGTVKRVIVFRTDGYKVDAVLGEPEKEERCNRRLHHLGGVYHCLRELGHEPDGHLFELPDVDTRIAWEKK